MSTQADASAYYVPSPTPWPLILTIGLVLVIFGVAGVLNNTYSPTPFLVVGIPLSIFILFKWFGGVIAESEGGAYNQQVDATYRWAMSWFIFSEVMFFGAFFGALFYARQLSLPWLAGSGAELTTNEFLWSGFEAVWPSNGPAEMGGDFQTIPEWGLPFINTVLLISSSFTVTWAHHALREDKRRACIAWMWATVVLGSIFLFFQAEEYIEAYTELNLTLGSGIYGSTFFLLTGFHGMHVTLGTLMLIIITLRLMRGHFKPDSHFGFEGVAWYWHFVDVVWLGLFVFVYVI